MCQPKFVSRHLRQNFDQVKETFLTTYNIYCCKSKNQQISNFSPQVPIFLHLNFTKIVKKFSRALGVRVRDVIRYEPVHGSRFNQFSVACFKQKLHQPSILSEFLIARNRHHLETINFLQSFNILYPKFTNFNRNKIPFHGIKIRNLFGIGTESFHLLWIFFFHYLLCQIGGTKHPAMNISFMK